MSSFFINKNNYTTILLVIAILSLGIFLRYDKFIEIPRHGSTFDEFAWVWLGINLIQKGTPISWSPHPQYKERQEIKYQGAAFLVVKPYLEHPPLFGLVAGSFALVNGVNDMYHVTLTKIRPLSIILGTFAVFMVFLFTRELYNNTIALFSSLLYATIPTVVIGSRIVQNENFLIPFWLLSLYLIVRYIKTRKTWLRNLAAIIAGLLSLAKVPWLVVGLSLSMIVSYKGKWRDAFIIGGATITMFSAYVLYGIYFDKDLFINILKLQTSRYDINFSGFFSIFTNPLLVDRFYLDGWILFGWFSIFMLLKDLKKNFLIVIPFIAYFVTFVLFIPNEPGHGWYRYPFYPFLIIAAAVIVYDEFKKISLTSVFFLLFIGLSLFSNTWQNIFGFSYWVYRLFILSVTLPIVFFLWKNIKGKFPNFIMISWIVFFLILNIVSVLSYIE